MYTVTKRKVREAEKRTERLHYKFINEYVKALHRDTFDKAEGLYLKIRQLYPQSVKDITKTSEFMEVVTPNKRIPRYYMSRKTVEPNREMLLQIPLISAPELTRFTAPAAAAAAAEVCQPPSGAAAEVCQPPSGAAAEVCQPPSGAAAEVCQPPLGAAAEVIQPIPEEVYQELLKELQKDSDLMRILDDIPLSTVPNDDDDVFTHMFDDIMPNNITPLEEELLFY